MEAKLYKNALVTSIGSVAADIVIKTLKRLDFNVIGCDIYPKEWIVDAGNVNKFYQVPYTIDFDNYFNCIKNICVDNKIDYIIPLTDVDVDFFNNNREWFEKENIIVCISPKESIDIIRNKKKFQDFVAKKCKFINSIPTELLTNVNTKKLPWAFPVVCKPYDGRSSQGLKYIYNQDEMDAFVSSNISVDKYIIEPFIEGDVVLVELIRNPSENKTIATSRKECLRTQHGCSLTVKLFQDITLEENSIKLANELKIKGSVNFEYIHTQNNEYYLIECNPRFSAGTEFTCMSQYDTVSNHIRCFNNKKIEDYHFRHVQYIARKYEEYITKTEE
ncbi:MAG: ATP-grasp domain-containing protein [Treponemataceae bacterium]